MSTEIGILRPIRMADLPAIAEMYQTQFREMQQRLGSELAGFEMPDPTKPHIFQVAVGECNGKVIGAAFFEAEVEVQVISDNPDFLKLLRLGQEVQENTLRLRNYKMLRAFIPIGLHQVGAMRRKGFKHMNPEWDCFAKAL
jgi:hypothetical protein